MNWDFNKIFKQLSAKWNIIVALISIIGLLIFNFFPNINESYFKLLIFLGFNAIIWTIIEIKNKLEDDKLNKIKRYSDMRRARPYILKDMYEVLSANKYDELVVEIVGGRIRTISDMIRELKNEIVNLNLHAQNILIKVYTISPSFINNWNFAKTRINSKLKERNEGNAQLIKHLTDELLNYNNLTEFKYNNIKIEVNYYDTYPFFYSFKIGIKYIYWGFFTWNCNDEDFIGPENPCYYLDIKDELFQDYYNFFTNRVQFLATCKQNEIPVS